MDKFSLIETILWRETYVFLSLHLQRLKRSCAYFHIPYVEQKIGKKLDEMSGTLSRGREIVVRLLVNQQGNAALSCKPFEKIERTVAVKRSARIIDEKNIFLFHKTTNREQYAVERTKALAKGFFDVLFTNQRNELTEGSISNIFLSLHGILYTPPVSSGLLPGVLREHLLRTKKAKEKLLYPEDLAKAEKIFIGNSVQGLLSAIV